ncbi:hypothetical protein [Paenibacillus radicis (ex Xue et al. 2023)]|uniref:Transcriptional regulator n=1 Tax=Paenibacillus radicis (ex Xue et al. 2023) TaxID=2972489 RepID=A0ABT1YFB4_9BACL|nr:hypothetical protein [Paenibacillus radicis (ex Xue et al. 2023)]MCR8631883.1 hypothetical protein [Paenibacillus radicis (ex Xue et al. 2023)]
MIARVGAVGPKDSIELIAEIGKEFQNQLFVIPFVYNSMNETSEIVMREEHDIDIWVFSGQAPYSIALEQPIKRKALFPQLNGSSLTKVLMEIVYRDRLILDRVSFDTILPHHFNETCTELDLTCDHIHLLSYTGFKPEEDLLEFHSQLFASGKVDACATCLSGVYEKLKAKGIPVYRIQPNRMTIRTMLNLASTEGETMHFKKSQIAVMLINIEETEKLIENKSSYDIRRLDLQFQEMIIDHVEALSGSFIALGNGKFLVFTTRGAFEAANSIADPSVLLEKLALLTDLKTNIGIGYGVTALAAERNAQLAIQHAKKSGNFIAILVKDTGEIEGPLQQAKSINFNYRTEDLQMLELLKKAGVTITTYNKMLSVQKNLGQNAISASLIAESLSMTKRNARRILSDLEEHNLAELIGEEAPSNRGRPSKIYRINPLTQSV